MRADFEPSNPAERVAGTILNITFPELWAASPLTSLSLIVFPFDSPLPAAEHLFTRPQRHLRSHLRGACHQVRPGFLLAARSSSNSDARLVVGRLRRGNFHSLTLRVPTPVPRLFNLYFE